MGRVAATVGSALVFGVVGLVIGWMVGGIFNQSLGALVGAGSAAAFGAIAGARADLTPRPEPEEKRGDLRSMTNEAWQDFLAWCAVRGTEPALVWWFRRLERPEPTSEVLVPLAFEDLHPTSADEAPSVGVGRATSLELSSRDQTPGEIENEIETSVPDEAVQPGGQPHL